MSRRDRDYEPSRVKRGTPFSRWFFGLFGFKSARRMREEREDEEE